jgi:hypothetical protein
MPKSDERSRRERDRSGKPSRSDDGGKDSARGSGKEMGVETGRGGQISHEKPPTGSKSASKDDQYFIAFLPSPSPSPPPERRREKRRVPFSQEWDQRKEAHAEGMVFDFSDVVDLGNRRHGMGVSRKAPWVTGVDWERCKNAPEMWEFVISNFPGIDSWIAGYIVRLKHFLTTFPPRPQKMNCVAS